MDAAKRADRMFEARHAYNERTWFRHQDRMGVFDSTVGHYVAGLEVPMPEDSVGRKICREALAVCLAERVPVPQRSAY